MWANVQLQVPDSWDRNQDIRRACGITDDMAGFVSRPDGSGTRQLTADVLAPFIGVAYGGGMSKSVPTRTSSTKPGMAPVYLP